MKVFHDGGCPLCNLEINQLKAAGHPIEFIDVSQPDFDPAEIGTDLATARYWLHWVDDSGRVLQGYEANIAMWRATGSRRLAAVADHAWVRPVGRLVYRGFARFRHPIGRLWRSFKHSTVPK